MVHLSVEAMADGNGLAKPIRSGMELNVVVPLAGLRQLQGIEDTDWAQRRTLQVGNCLDTPVWWSVADGRVYVLVGEDNEVRALAVTIPLSAVHEVLALAEKEPQQSFHPVRRVLGAIASASQTRLPGPLLTVWASTGADSLDRAGKEWC